MESDPVGLGGGINLYAYANDNPLNAIDPDGKRWVWFCVRRLIYGNGGIARGLIWGLYPLFGHCYIKFGDDARGFYPDDESGYWTVRPEDERTIIVNRLCRPTWVSDCRYNCLKIKMNFGNRGSSIAGAGIFNNCCTNLKTVRDSCRKDCECED